MTIKVIAKGRNSGVSVKHMAIFLGVSSPTAPLPGGSRSHQGLNVAQSFAPGQYQALGLHPFMSEQYQSLMHLVAQRNVVSDQ